MVKLIDNFLQTDRYLSKDFYRQQSLQITFETCQTAFQELHDEVVCIVTNTEMYK